VKQLLSGDVIQLQFGMDGSIPSFADEPTYESRAHESGAQIAIVAVSQMTEVTPVLNRTEALTQLDILKLYGERNKAIGRYESLEGGAERWLESDARAAYIGAAHKRAERAQADIVSKFAELHGERARIVEEMTEATRDAFRAYDAHYGVAGQIGRQRRRSLKQQLQAALDR
jgi:hypothetical protein